MSVLTYLLQADIRDAKDEIEGKVLTRPALLVTDGVGLVYACDVDIGKENPLRNVPIATGNRDVCYAEAGNPVTLRKSPSGQFRITGFAKQMPGTFIRIPVHIATGALGSPLDIGLSSRALTLDELSSYGGGFGLIPLGSIATFRGATLLNLSS